MIELIDVGINRASFSLKGLTMKLDLPGLHLLTGETGTGKTTIVEAICGLQPISRGQIRLRGQGAESLSIAERSIGYFPQDLALMDHLSVRENICFPCRARRWSLELTSSKVDQLANELGVSEWLDRKPSALSGGQQHIVALARALAFEPDIICLDEPFAGLDKQTHAHISRWFESYIHNNSVTALVVTHRDDWARRIAKTRWTIDQTKILTKVEPGSG